MAGKKMSTDHLPVGYGARITALRKRLGLKREVMAERLVISTATLRRYELELSTPCGLIWDAILTAEQLGRLDGRRASPFLGGARRRYLRKSEAANFVSIYHLHLSLKGFNRIGFYNFINALARNGLDTVWIDPDPVVDGQVVRQRTKQRLPSAVVRAVGARRP